MKSTSYVYMETEDEVSIINLNDEKSFNALSHSVLEELFYCLKMPIPTNRQK